MFRRYFAFPVLILILFACNDQATGKQTTAVTEVSNSSDTPVVALPDPIPVENIPDSAVAVRTVPSEHKMPVIRPPFQVLSSTFGNWTSGVRDGGKGTEYTFRILVKTARKLVFDSAWIGNRRFLAHMTKEGVASGQAPLVARAGDTLLVRVSEEYKVSRDEIPQQSPPLKFNGAALLRYYVDGERNYFIIKSIKQVNAPNRP
ncbi:MAG TPA: hypothetical protein VFZ78_08455 [Flavisolibacter sp.]